MAETYGKIKRIILAENDPQLRNDLCHTLLHLADDVERFSDGDDALSFAKGYPAELVVLSLGAWNSLEEAIKAIKAANFISPEHLVIAANKMMPQHLSQLRKLHIKNIFPYPLNDVYIFRIVHELYGIINRRHPRIVYNGEVFWGKNEDYEAIGQTLDISRGGMRLLSEKKLTLGASFYWGIKLDNDRIFQGRGEVLKEDTVTYAPKLAYGISFAELPIPSTQLLDETINQRLEQGAALADISFLDELK